MENTISSVTTLETSESKPETVLIGMFPIKFKEEDGWSDYKNSIGPDQPFLS